jgi:hypothetical protein
MLLGLRPHHEGRCLDIPWDIPCTGTGDHGLLAETQFPARYLTKIVEWNKASRQ